MCQSFDASGDCKACVYRSVPNGKGKCLEVNPQCNTFNNKTGACKSCYGGYALKNGNCVVSKQPAEVSGSSDGNCRKSDKGKCVECSFRYFLNSKGACEQISDLCNGFDSKGQCTNCYKGYVLLKDGRCVVPDK